MKDVFFLGHRDRAYALVVGLMKLGIAAKATPVGGEAASVALFNPEDRKAAINAVPDILTDIFVGRRNTEEA